MEIMYFKTVFASVPATGDVEVESFYRYVCRLAECKRAEVE